MEGGQWQARLHKSMGAEIVTLSILLPMVYKYEPRR